jgi:hypothetical protein
VARVVGERKPKRIFLQRSLRTKDRAEAKRLALPVLMEFEQTLKLAEALITEDPPLPVRTTLSDH